MQLYKSSPKFSRLGGINRLVRRPVQNVTFLCTLHTIQSNLPFISLLALLLETANGEALLSLNFLKHSPMSSMMTTLYSYPSPTFRNSPHLPPKITPHAPRHIHCNCKNTTQALQFVKPQGVKFGLGQIGFSGTKLGFSIRAENGGVGGETKMSKEEEEEKELEELRGKSTMPERFKYSATEAPSPIPRWPFFVGLALLIYAWRTVSWELSNWRKLVMGIFQFVGYLSKLVLAVIFHFIGDPITYTILYIETALNAIRSFYSSVVTSAPISELTVIIMLASTILAIGEAVSPKSMSEQPYLLTVAGVIGYGAVRGVITEPFFWLMLFGLFIFARFVKKRDYVSSTLPVATVLASVGEPWVRLLSIMTFSALAIHHHSKNPMQGKEEAEVTVSSGKVPFPLLAVALAIGVRLAAKWAGYRHLTWMVV